MRRRILELIILLGVAIFAGLILIGINAGKGLSANNSQAIGSLPNFPSASATPNQMDSSKPAILGELTIPAAEVLALPITRGIDKATLNTGMAGAYPWSGPGQSGVFALAAHRVGAGGPFRNLDRISLGDRITVKVKGKSYVYRVISNITVAPTDTYVLDGPDDDSRIVLITCTPLETFDQRIVVTGQLIR
ncbi:MAG: class E sortase [Actinomycetales bacterium]|nr:class E sortase [Actinomycetales bacterium]